MDFHVFSGSPETDTNGWVLVFAIAFQAVGFVPECERLLLPPV